MCRGCGGGGAGGHNNPGATVSLPAGSGETIMVAYAGEKRGTMQVRGPVSRLWYSFSATPKGRVKPVARGDAEFLLRRRDFVLQPPAAPAAPPPAAPMPLAAPPPAARRATAPQVQRIDQPTTQLPIDLIEEAPADDLAEIRGITADTAGILALISVRTFEDLASLENIVGAAQLTGKSENVVRKWIAQAKERIGKPDEPEPVEPDFSAIDVAALGNLGDVGDSIPAVIQ